MSFCAPKRQQKGNEWSCFNVQELHAMADTWNDTRVGKPNPIDLGQIDDLDVIEDDENSFRETGGGTHEKDVKMHLWSELYNRFSKYCGENEGCWLDSIEFSKHLKKKYPDLYKTIQFFTLKPKGLKGKNDWLSTTEIDYVLQQYEDQFPDFKYIGCFPSDYYKLNPNKFPTKILMQYRYAGLVFNLDESHQRGSHWIAVFIERDPVKGHLIVEYFDPTGDAPNKNLSNFLDHPEFQDADVFESTFKHQKGDNECGMYSMHYIMERLKGRSLVDINESRITDKQMNEFRKFVFRPYTEQFSMT